MSEANIRRLRRAPGFKSLDVPEGFDRGVGFAPEGGGRFPKDKAQAPAVEQHGNELIARFEAAQKAASELSSKAKAGKKKDGGRPILAEDIAKPFAELVDYIQTVGINARNPSDGSPTVVADAAAALMSLDPITRDMVLRRAGYPEVFEPLRNSKLPDPPEDGAIARDIGREEGRKSVKGEEKKIAEAGATENLPQIKRWSSHFAQPDTIGKDGKIQQSSDKYKNTEPTGDSPLDVVGPRDQEARIKSLGYTDEQIARMSQEKKDKLAVRHGDKKMGEARSKLAGDQIAQVRAIEKKHGEGSARLPQAVANKDFPQSTEVTMAIGTDPNYWSASDARNRTRGRSGATTARTVDARNRGEIQKNLELLYSLTQPMPATDPTTGAAKVKQMFSTKQVVPAQMETPLGTTVDLDAYFPWWRGRFAVADEAGNLTYPSRLPSAEFITGLIEGSHGAQDPEFFQRMLPLIQRSINAAPESPSTDRARRMSEKVFLPSKQFLETMQGGIGSKDFPYGIYGQREIARPEVSAPERHPFNKPEFQPPAKAESAIDEYRRLMGEPGLGDQSSIYKVPPNSPMRMLLA